FFELKNFEGIYQRSSSNYFGRHFTLFTSQLHSTLISLDMECSSGRLDW
ncbi:3854_t:CDS:1, partial [Scutellospora calospora]